MNKIFITVIGLVTNTLLFATVHAGRNEPLHVFHFENYAVTDSLPSVLGENRGDLIEKSMRAEAVLRSATHQLPGNLGEWEKTRESLREKIISQSGVQVDHDLPLDMKETGSLQMKGYTIKNIYFQTQAGVYATANLYIPDGEGPFPAVVNMHGHWREGKMAESVQAVGHSLALNGYVCLVIDAFGAGERATTHGDFEYHGANLGASLMNIGESLLGVQVTDNMRAVDLLVSLPFVDAENIGATGASGGGNQTMWFAALDERVKAALPIVSVGTFESAVMGSNCVCELLPGGLSFTETAGVLGLYAPRALKMCNHHRDSNPTFYPEEMLRSYHNAKPLFRMYGVEDHIDYELFDLTHGYWPEDREVMLGWFDLHLKGKGTGASRMEQPFENLPEEKLMVFELGKRDPLVMSTDDYSRIKGSELRNSFLSQKSFDKERKMRELQNILMLKEQPELLRTHTFDTRQGWERLALETSDHKLIPILHRAPKTKGGEYTLISHAQGKNKIPQNLLDELMEKGSGIVVVEISGTGEASSARDTEGTSLSEFHTLSRAHLWLGKTLMGEWTQELAIVAQFIRDNYQPSSLLLDGSREAGLAGMFLGAMKQGVWDGLIVRETPISYLFDNRANIDFFSMGIHVPGFLRWGDVSLAAALSGLHMEFINPLTMSGEKVEGNSLKKFGEEYEKIRKISNQTGKVSFKP